jgi:hypothetical protein
MHERPQSTPDHRKFRNQEVIEMNRIGKIVSLAILTITMLVINVGAFEITSPSQYTEVHPRDVVLIKVQLSPGEQVSGIYFDTFAKEITSPHYEYQYKIGPNQLGNIVVTIIAIKPESEGPFATADDAFASTAALHLKSTLPSTAKIQSLRADSDFNPIFFSIKKDMSSGNYIQKTSELRVYAKYSDGIERSASSASTGTTYSSSDEKILTIDANGLMAALSPGKVKITIKNGDYMIVLDATIKLN